MLGAVYASGLVFPQLSSWYDFPIKILFSGVLVILAFWPRNWSQFLKSWAYFYGVSFAMAGAVIGFSYLFRKIPWQAGMHFSYLWLGGGVICALALGTYGNKMMREQIVPRVMQCPVQVRFDSTWCSGHGFIDTGHNLVDPLTSKPVVIAEYQLVSTCFPGDVQSVMKNQESKDNLFDVLATTSWGHRLRLIPFTSIGKNHGLLVGIRSDEVAIQAGNKWFSYPGIVIGIYQEKLSPEGNFQMLLPASIFKNGG
jgi:stage II sporulation protein GA (sporulation sigma-E factor processing peptidase)